MNAQQVHVRQCHKTSLPEVFSPFQQPSEAQISWKEPRPNRAALQVGAAA